MTQARGMISRRSGPAVTATDRRSAPLGARPVCRGKVTKSSAIPPQRARFFLHRPTVVCRAPRPLFPPRLVRSKSCAFSVSAPQFFRRSPALFSFGGWVAPSVGVKCAVSRAYVSRPRQPLFVFSLHRFTHPDNMLTHKQLCVKTSPFCLPPLPPRARRPDRGVKTAAK